MDEASACCCRSACWVIIILQPRCVDFIITQKRAAGRRLPPTWGERTVSPDPVSTGRWDWTEQNGLLYLYLISSWTLIHQVQTDWDQEFVMVWVLLVSSVSPLDLIHHLETGCVTPWCWWVSDLNLRSSWGDQWRPADCGGVSLRHHLLQTSNNNQEEAESHPGDQRGGRLCDLTGRLQSTGGGLEPGPGGGPGSWYVAWSPVQT